MNRNRLFIGLTVAVFIALIASVYVYRTFQRVSRGASRDTATIVVADEPLQVGTPLDADKVRTISWPADEPIAGSFRRVEDCVGGQ